MHAIVCIKQVPESPNVGIDPSTNTLIREGIPSIINPFDMYAIEEALLLKERLGGEVTAVTMGPEGADAVLRRCLAKGADRAVWLKDEAFEGSDAYATAKILHASMKDLEFDLVMAGAQASDDGHGAVGVFLAELLGIPHASMVKKVEAGEGSYSVNRELEGGLEEVVELSVPAVLTIQTGINEPRYVSIMGIRRARKKEITIMGLTDLGLSEGDVGEEGSWMRIERVYRPPVDKEPVMMSGSPDEVAGELVELFRARGLV